MATGEGSQVYFVNTKDSPIKTKHICYFTKSESHLYELYEVVEEYFPHPDAPDDALIFRIEIYKRDRRELTEQGSGPLIQSWAMENTLKMLYPINNENDQQI